MPMAQQIGRPAIAITPGPAENAVASNHAQSADTATPIALNAVMRARSYEGRERVADAPGFDAQLISRYPEADHRHFAETICS